YVHFLSILFLAAIVSVIRGQRTADREMSRYALMTPVTMVLCAAMSWWILPLLFHSRLGLVLWLLCGVTFVFFIEGVGWRFPEINRKATEEERELFARV